MGVFYFQRELLDLNSKEDFKEEDSSSLSAYLNFPAEGKGILRENH